MGNLKRDQFILNYDGVDQVEWRNKDRDKYELIKEGIYKPLRIKIVKFKYASGLKRVLPVSHL